MGTTQTVRLERGASGVVVPTFRPVFSFDDGDRVLPRTLRTDVRLMFPSATDEMQRGWAQAIGGAGVWSNEIEGGNEPWFGGGALRLTYGSHPGIRRTVVADLRGGEFAIPPCAQFELSAAYWNPKGEEDGMPDVLELAAELAPGQTAEASPLLLTATRQVSSSTICAIPPGAYAWEVYSHDQPVRARAGAVQVRRTPNGGAWEPPTTPHPILPGAAQIAVYRGAGADSSPWWPTLVFYVR